MADGLHTPGPWVRAGLTVKVAGPDIIATCPTPQNGGEMECVANARLIASAPELLAACKGWIDYIGAPAEQGDGKHEDWLLDQMRAAIAKASSTEGEG